MAVNGWPSTSPTGAILDYAYIRFGGDNSDIFPISIKSIPNVILSTEAGLGSSSSNTLYTHNTIQFGDTGVGTQNTKPIYIDFGSYGTKPLIPIYTDLSSYGTKTDKPIYTYLSNVGTTHATPIYIRNAVPVSEFISQIALQIYSWSNSMSSDGNSTIGTARNAAHQAFERAEEYVKQLVNRKFIAIERGLIKWNMNVNDFIKNLN